MACLPFFLGAIVGSAHQFDEIGLGHFRPLQRGDQHADDRGHQMLAAGDTYGLVAHGAVLHPLLQGAEAAHVEIAPDDLAGVVVIIVVHLCSPFVLGLSRFFWIFFWDFFTVTRISWRSAPSRRWRRYSPPPSAWRRGASGRTW